MYVLYCKLQNSNFLISLSSDAIDPIGVWPLNSVTKGQDMSGSGNHITQTSFTFADAPDGSKNGAVQFGQSEFLDIKNTGTANSVAVQSFTVMLHVYPINGATMYVFDWRTKSYGIADHLAIVSLKVCNKVCSDSPMAHFCSSLKVLGRRIFGKTHPINEAYFATKFTVNQKRTCISQLIQIHTVQLSSWIYIHPFISPFKMFPNQLLSNPHRAG